MPLIVLSGYPLSLKTTRVLQLKEHFESLGKEVFIVSEEQVIEKAGFTRNVLYNDSRKEKQIRDTCKSEVTKLITPRNVVIFDGPNYIKGYRYELYCSMKANHSTQCTIYTIIHQDEAWKLNESHSDEFKKYDRSTFDGLLLRFEEPDGRNRWDAPLFVVGQHEKIDFESVNRSLFENAAPPPNLSTQNAPLSSTNFLYEMNKVVKEITSGLIIKMKSGCNELTEVPKHEDLEIDLQNASIPTLLSLSKQYINYSKLNTPDIKDVPSLYVQFLQANFGTT